MLREGECKRRYFGKKTEKTFGCDGRAARGMDQTDRKVIGMLLILYCTPSHMWGHVTSSANGQLYTIKNIKKS